MTELTGLLELPEFSEKQSKSSSSVVLFLCCIAIVVGFLIIYDSTTEIAIKNNLSFGIGSAIVLMALFVLFSLYMSIYKKEEKLRFQRLYSNTIQLTVNELDLLIKLMEYNEKAIAYNEKNESPKMDILDLSDLANMATNNLPD